MSVSALSLSGNLFHKIGAADANARSPYVQVDEDVYAKLHCDASFEMRISNDGPEVFSSYASRKSRSEITV